MRVLKNEDVNKKEWTTFVANYPGGTVFQTREMYEVYKRAKRHTPLLLVVVDNASKVLAGLLAVVVWEPKLKLFSSRAIIKGGPMWVNERALKLLMWDYNKWASKHAIYSDIRNVFDSPELNASLSDWKFEAELNFISDLGVGKEELWCQLTKARRNGVTKAQRTGVTVREASREDLDVIYELFAHTYKHAKMPLADISFFELLFDVLVSARLAKFWLAEKDDKQIAVMFVLTHRGLIYDWYAGADGKYLKFCPNDLLAWNAIEWGAQNGFEVFDFGGAGDPNEPYGVREFKKQFGGELVNYGRFVKIHHPLKRKLGERCFELYRKFL